MSEESERSGMEECAAKLSSAAQALENVIGKLEAQYEALNQKIDRIIATVEKTAAEESGESTVEACAYSGEQAEQLAQLEQENRELRQRVGRKTVAPMVSALLAKSGVGEGAHVEAGALDKALSALTVEQRIAVKAELARAGVIG